MPRIRDLAIYQSSLSPGRQNGITDVPGVAVGHATLHSGSGAWTGNGPFRTGVTLVLPHRGNLYADKVAAAVHTINGFGKVIGFEQVRELGALETPIALTGTLNAPRVADGLISLAIAENPHIGLGFAATGRRGYASVNPVVGETNDGVLSDMQARPLRLSHVRAALNAASTGPVAEGSVGAGTGTSCFGWKGGIGSASRLIRLTERTFTLGALVQTNFGRPEELTICGVPVGRYFQPRAVPPPVTIADGSIMIVLATDAPLQPHQLERLAKRAVFGLARTGSTGHGGSGDFVIAFSTTNRFLEQGEVGVVERPYFYLQPHFNQFSLAVVETVEEAIYNSLLQAESVVGRDGHTRWGLPAEAVEQIVREHAGQR